MKLGKLFNRFKKKQIRPKTLYAVTAGVYIGQFFLFMNHIPKDGMFEVLSMPDMIPMSIDEQSIIEGLQKDILDKIETLPDNVFDLCTAEYNHRLKLKETNDTNTRREQPIAQSTLDESNEELQN